MYVLFAVQSDVQQSEGTIQTGYIEIKQIRHLPEHPSPFIFNTFYFDSNYCEYPYRRKGVHVKSLLIDHA